MLYARQLYADNPARAVKLPPMQMNGGMTPSPTVSLQSQLKAMTKKPNLMQTLQQVSEADKAKEVQVSVISKALQENRSK